MRIVHWISVALFAVTLVIGVSQTTAEPKIVKASDPSSLKLAFVTNNAS